MPFGTRLMSNSVPEDLVNALLREQMRLQSELDKAQVEVIRLRQADTPAPVPAPTPAPAQALAENCNCMICFGPVMVPVLVGCSNSGFCGERQHGHHQCSGAIVCLLCARSAYGRPRYDEVGTPRTFSCLKCRSPILAGRFFQEKVALTRKRIITIADLYIVLVSMFPVHNALYATCGIAHECPRCSEKFDCQAALYRHMTATRPGTNVALCSAGFPTGIVSHISHEEVLAAVRSRDDYLDAM